MWQPTLTGPIFWHNIPEYLLTMLCTLILADHLIASPKPTVASTLRFWGRLILTSALAALLAEMGKHYQVWPGHPGFPSGHTALTVALCWNLYLRHKANNTYWLWFLLAIAVFQGVRLVLGNAHTPIEVFVGAILGTVFPLLWDKIAKNRKQN
jgi:membrane-associated phospholipid phosphatase